jgi:sugar O-acyltransferase (sialic acid O-acetyltransferase NeuD family)
MADWSNVPTNELVVVGGGGHAKVVISIIRKLGKYRLLGYTDLMDRGTLLDAPYLGSDAALAPFAAKSPKLSLVLGLGQVGLGDLRRELWDRLRQYTLPIPPLISPDAVVNEGTSIGDGTAVFDGAVINTGAQIGRGAIVNTNSTIEHDVVLEDWVHVGPGTIISGDTRVGAHCMIGAGAVVIEGREIADGCLVGAGAIVIHDLKEPGVYVGCPARRLS